MQEPYLSIIIPAYNEMHRIGKTLESIRAYLQSVSYAAEVLVVINNTTDDTQHVVKSFETSMPYMRILNTGMMDSDSGTKGAAVRKGMLEAKGAYVLFMDADNATELKEIENFWPHFDAGYDIVFGSRYIKGAHTHRIWYRNIMGRVSNFLVQAVLLPGIKDTQCGFKCFTSKAAKDIFSRSVIQGWGFDLEVLALARKLGYSMKEAPIVWHEIGHSAVKAGAFFSTLRELVVIRKRVGTIV
jgi:dolichyl-phosphate beta-glucosyltransferase